MKPQKIERLFSIHYHGTSVTNKFAFIRVRRKRELVMELAVATGKYNFGEWRTHWDGRDDIISINDDIRITCTSRNVRWTASFKTVDNSYRKNSDGEIHWLRKVEM